MAFMFMPSKLNHQHRLEANVSHSHLIFFELCNPTY